MTVVLRFNERYSGLFVEQFVGWARETDFIGHNWAVNCSNKELTTIREV